MQKESLPQCLLFKLGFFVPCHLFLLVWCQFSGHSYHWYKASCFSDFIYLHRNRFPQFSNILTPIDADVWERISLTFSTHGSGEAQICSTNTNCANKGRVNQSVWPHLVQMCQIWGKVKYCKCCFQSPRCLYM